MIAAQKIDDAIRDKLITELAIGYLRYEALRKLNPRQYTELCQRNRQGEWFDEMVDELVNKKEQHNEPR